MLDALLSLVEVMLDSRKHGGAGGQHGVHIRNRRYHRRSQAKVARGVAIQYLEWRALLGHVECGVVPVLREWEPDAKQRDESMCRNKDSKEEES